MNTYEVCLNEWENDKLIKLTIKADKYISTLEDYTFYKGSDKIAQLNYGCVMYVLKIEDE